MVSFGMDAIRHGGWERTGLWTTEKAQCRLAQRFFCWCIELLICKSFVKATVLWTSTTHGWSRKLLMCSTLMFEKLKLGLIDLQSATWSFTKIGSMLCYLPYSSMEASTLEMSHPDSLLMAIRNIYIWARDSTGQIFLIQQLVWIFYLELHSQGFQWQNRFDFLLLSPSCKVQNLSVLRGLNELNILTVGL